MFEVGDLIERKSGNTVIRGVVTSNDRAGLFILSVSGFHMQIPSSNVRKITGGPEYAALRRLMDLRLKQFNS